MGISVHISILIQFQYPINRADLTNFLLPSSRLPTDVTFMVSGKEVGAHKSFLATAHPAFDQMFFEAEAGARVTRVKVSY